MKNVKVLKAEDMEKVCGGTPMFPTTPGMGLPLYPYQEKEEPRDGGATGSW